MSTNAALRRLLVPAHPIDSRVYTGDMYVSFSLPALVPGDYTGSHGCPLALYILLPASFDQSSVVGQYVFVQKIRSSHVLGHSGLMPFVRPLL